MGSVPDLYTTGDNDPEIYPVSYYRHYLYCDGCGSFELDPWWQPDGHERLEKTRQRLRGLALIAVAVALVAGWEALGLFPAPVFLVVLAVGLVIPSVFWGLGEQGAAQSLPRRFTKAALLWLPVVAVAGWLADEILPRLPMFFAALIAVTGLLIARQRLGARIQLRGRRCRHCAATYAHGTPFFSDLDANPRQLTVADVPRPLGRSPFEIGRSAKTGLV